MQLFTVKYLNINKMFEFFIYTIINLVVNIFIYYNLFYFVHFKTNNLTINNNKIDFIKYF